MTPSLGPLRVKITIKVLIKSVCFTKKERKKKPRKNKNKNQKLSLSFLLPGGGGGRAKAGVSNTAVCHESFDAGLGN